MKILVAEDQAEIRFMVSKALRLWRCEVIEAETAAKAIGVFNNDPEGFDFVLTNLDMEDPVAGLSVIREVKKKRPHLPVVLISGTLTPEVIEQAESMGVNGCFNKPFGIADLKAMLGL